MKDETSDALRVRHLAVDRPRRDAAMSSGASAPDRHYKRSGPRYVAEDDVSVSELFSILSLYPVTIVTSTLAAAALGFGLTTGHAQAPTAHALVALEDGASVDTGPAAVEALLEATLTQTDGAALATLTRKDTSDETAIRHLSKTIRITVDNGLAEIAATDRDPQIAVLLANAIATTLVEQTAPAPTVEAPVDTTSWLASRISDLELDIDRKTFELEGLRSAAPPAPKVDKAKARRVQDLEAAVDVARDALSQTQTLYREIVDAEDPSQAPAVLSSPILLKLHRTVTETEDALGQVEAANGEENAQTAELREKLASTIARIDREIAHIAESYRSEVEVAQRRLEGLETRLAAARASLDASATAAPDVNAGIAALERSLEQAQTRLAEYKAMVADVEAPVAAPMPSTRLVSPAMVAQASPSWSRFLWAGVFTLLGLAGGCGLALLKNLRDDRLDDAADISHKVGAQVLTTIPELDSDLTRRLSPDERRPEDYLVNHPLSDFTESFRLLLSGLLAASRDPRKHIVAAVSSASHGEGKTTICLSLARAAAMMGKRVLVVDAAIDEPTISRQSDGGRPFDLVSALIEPETLSQAIANRPGGYEDILPVRMHEEAVLAEAFTPERLQRLFENLRMSYDVVLVDCPPVRSSAQAQMVAAACDGVILVSRSSRTTARSVQVALSATHDAGGNSLGVLLNFARS